MQQNMKKYDYFLYGEDDAYGEAQLSEEVNGQVTMAIYVSNKSVQDNINYQNANYVGLTNDRSIDDNYVIQYGDERLKVLYIVDAGAKHYRQVFMSRM